MNIWSRRKEGKKPPATEVTLPRAAAPTALRQASRTQADVSAQGEAPSWKRGAKNGARRFVYVAVLAIGWSLAAHLRLVDRHVAQNINECVAALLFILAIPCSVFLRLDSLFESWSPRFDPELLLLAALPMVLLNFVVIGAIRGALRAAGEKSQQNRKR